MTRHAPAHRPGPAPARFDHLDDRPAPRFSRVLVVAVGAVAPPLFMLPGVALAYFLTTSSSNAEAAAATLAVPTAGAQNGTATPGTVPIIWTAPASYTPTGYTVLRCSGSSCTNFTAISTGSCSGTISGTSCLDTDSTLQASTTYNYEVEAQRNNWVSSPGSSFNAATSLLTSLTFTSQPSSGANIQATGSGGFGVSVAIEDVHGNVAANDSTDTVTLAIASGDNPGSGTLTCTGGLTVTASSGVATFTGCDISKVGTGYELTASSSTDTSLHAPANANSFTITAGNVSQFAVGGLAATETAGTQVTGVTLTAEDANGNVVTNFINSKSITWSGPASSPIGTAPSLPTGTVNFTSGVSTTSLNVTFTDAGPQTLTATDGGLTGSASTTVNAGNASLFSVGGLGSAATAGTPVTGLTLTAEDTDGNTATGFTGSQPIVWSDPATSPGGNKPTLPAGTINFSNGASTTSLSVTFTDAVAQTLTATQGSITGSANITVSPGTATQFSVGVASTATAGTAVTGWKLTAEDADGNTATGFTGSQPITWSDLATSTNQPATSPNGTAPTLPSGPIIFSSGVSPTLSATFTDAVQQKLTATQGSLTGSATITVSSGTAAKFVVGNLASTATAGTAVTGWKLTAQDAYGNTAIGFTGSQPITWSDLATSTNQPATAPNGTPPTLPSGPITFSSGVSPTLSATFTDAVQQTLTATQGSVTSSVTITVSGGAPASLVLANCSVSSGITPTGCSGSYTGFGNGTNGTVTAYVQALDQYGNAATISSTINLTVSITTGRYSISTTSLAITGSATPPNQSTGSVTVTKGNFGNGSATITIHATGFTNISFTVAS